MSKASLLILFASMTMLCACSTPTVIKECAPAPANMKSRCPETLSPSPDGKRSSLLATGKINDQEYAECRDRHNTTAEYLESREKSK